MAIKAMVKTLDGLNDAQKALYKQGDGGFILDVEPVDGFALENVAGLKSAVQREREQREAAEKSAKAFEGIDVAKARDALAKVEKLGSLTTDEKVQQLIEQRTKALAESKDKEADTLKQQLAKYRQSYEAVTLDSALKDAAAKHKFIQPALAPKLFRDAVMLQETDAGMVAAVKGSDGKPQQIVNNDGTMRLKTIDEFVAEQAASELYSPLVAGNKATGTQGRQQPTSTNQSKPVRPVDSGALIREAVTMAGK